MSASGVLPGPAGTPDRHARPADPWLPTAPCAPHACVATPRRRGAPRALLRLTLCAAVTCAGILAAPLAARCAPARRDRLVRRWCRALAASLGIRVVLTGTAPPTGGLLLVAHHVSWLDVPLLALVRPARMLAKAEVRRWPLAGALAAVGGTLFIERTRPRALPATVDTIAGALRAGSAVGVFPEGSTWCGRAHGRFHRAVFQAALDAGAPVQPVRIRYLVDRPRGGPSTAPAFVGDDTLLASLWRTATTRGVVARVETAGLLPAGTHPDRRSLARAAETAIHDAGRAAPP